MTDRTDHSEVVGHTPGERWVISDARTVDGEFMVCGGEPFGLIATVSAEEDARLIASAPALLEALKYGFDLYGDEGPDGPWPIEKRREFNRLARAALLRALPNTENNNG